MNITMIAVKSETQTNEQSSSIVMQANERLAGFCALLLKETFIEARNF